MSGSSPNVFERLAVAQALYKAVGAQVSATTRGNLRDAADAEFRALGCSAGVDRVRLSVNGQEVGTMSTVYSRATEGPEVTDEGAYEAWLAENGEADFELHPEWLTREQRARVAALMRELSPSTVVPTHDIPPDVRSGLSEGPGGRVLTADGEVVAGMAWVRHPKAPRGVAVRGCEPEKVAKALGDALPGVVMGLLSDGGEVG